MKKTSTPNQLRVGPASSRAAEIVEERLAGTLAPPSKTVIINLREPATDMTREEMLKQVAHLSNSLRNPRLSPDGFQLKFDVDAKDAENAKQHAEHLCALIQRSLRNVQRKVAYRTRAMSRPSLHGTTAPGDGIIMAGRGQVMLEGVPLQLFRYFDNALAELERNWTTQELLTPTLIPTDVLAKCDYFRSFPNTVTFACHLEPDANIINSFRARHEKKTTIDREALADMATPEACLSPAVCYHVYHRNQRATLPPEGIAYSVRGKCFRYESSNLREMTRLWDFTMRELVFLGTSDYVLQERERCVQIIGEFLDDLGLAAEIRTASDPFYIAPDASSKTYFQLTAETKYELSAVLPNDQRLAIGSLNYHTDFFGRAFDINVDGAGPAFSSCIGFGLERFVCAFLAQHGKDPSNWPAEVRTAFVEEPLATLS
jgi:seryl-tRNA synthetase